MGLIVDLFAGAGGASAGITSALQRDVDIAVNHSPRAIAQHEANHPNTVHHQTDVFDVDPQTACAGQPVDLLWASPDCTFFSRAKGAVPIREAGAKSRSLAWVVVNWAAAVAPSTIILENVPEFIDWGPLMAGPEGNLIPDPDRKGATFQEFVAQLRALGYDVDWRTLVAADYGEPTIRNRLYLVAKRDGPITWPTPTHARQPAQDKPRWVGVNTVIDWSIPCPSIFTRKRPLADNTCRRIAHGVMKYVVGASEPFIVRSGHTSSAVANKVKSLQEPLSTVVTKNSHMLVSAFIAKHFGGNKQQMAAPADSPFPTVTVRGTQNQLVSCALTQFRGSNLYGHGLEEPLRTITAGGNHYGIINCLLQQTLHTTEHGTHGRSLESSGPEYDRGQTQRRDMAHGLDATGQDPEGRTTAAGRASQSRLSRSQGHGRSEVLSGDCTPSRVDGEQRADSTGNGHQPSRRKQSQQQPIQPGVGDSVSESQARLSDRPSEVTARPDTKVGNRRGKAVKDVGLVLLEDRAEVAHLSDECFQSATRVAAFIIKFYSSGGQWQSLLDPLHTVTTKGRFGLVTCSIGGEEHVITDIGMRMLTPRELALAQGFSPDYVLHGNKTQQVAGIGNSVCPGVARSLVAANCQDYIATKLVPCL